jgi:HEAT repeat protein
VNTPMHLRTIVFGLLILAGHNVAHSQGSDSQQLHNLLELATSEAASERVDAAKGLGLSAYPQAATDTLLVLLKDKQWFVRGAAADSLKSRGDLSVVTALTNAVESETNENVRERMSAALSALTRPGNLVSGFTDPDPAVREKAAANGARIPISQVDDALVLLLNDPVPAVRSAAAESLVTQRNPAVAEYEIRTLETSTDASTRQRAAAFLGDLRILAAVEPLIRTLSDKSIPADSPLRGQVLQALSEIGDPRAAKPIVDTLPSASLSRYESVLALSKLGDAGLTALIGLLQDSDESTRSLVATTLKLFKGPQVIAALVTTLNDPSDIVRGSAATSLGMIGDPRATQPLLNALEINRISNQQVASALGSLNDRRAIPALLSELRNIISRQESMTIIGVLGKYGGTDSLNALIQVVQGQFVSKHTFENLELQSAAGQVARIGGSRAEFILFDELRKQDLPAIQGAVRYFIALGRDGSEYPLAKALDPQNQQLRGLAELYLASGQPILIAAAHEWAAAQNVNISPALYQPVNWKQGALPR